MMRRVRDYLLSLIVVFTAYWVYAQSFVRMIEPPPTPRREITTTGGVENVKRRHPYEHLFAAGDWELENPKLLETTQGTLLFHEYLPREQGKLEIRPCTLIVFSGANEAQAELSARPIVLRANQGAILEFQGGVDLARAKFGRLTGGRIQGEVRVFSPESTPGAGDNIELVTRNIQIEPQRVWTPHEVKFRYGQSYGSGQDFIMSLAPAERVVNKKTPISPFGRVEGLQVTQINELILKAKRGGFFPNPNATTPDNSASEEVRITCEGPFKFDAIRSIATFEENVLVERREPGLGPVRNPDRLKCKQFGVFFSTGLARPGEVNMPSPLDAEQDSTAKTPAPRGIERIVAIGTPVIMESATQQAYSEAERLEYNLQTRQILLKMLNSTGRVKMRRANDEFIAPELAYELGSQHRIGRLWAPGPGKLVSATGTGTDRRQFTAQWRREIRMRPQEENLVISLMDDAQIEVEQQGNFRANELHLWLLELPGSASPSRNSPGNLAGANLLPDRLLALGQVRVQSTQLTANLDRVEAWFEHQPVERTAPVVQAAPANPNVLQLQPASGPVVALPAAPPIKEPMGQTAAATPSASQFHVLGEIARMQLKTRGTLTTLENLSVEGKSVKVTETNAAATEQPLFLKGTKIDLSGGIGREMVIALQGEPALVTARDMSIRSQQLTLNRRDNRLIVEHPGDLTLPVKQGFHGEELATPQALQIAWQGSFVFDGLLAKFRQNVSVRGPGYNAVSDELQASLNRALTFDSEASQGAVELRSLGLFGHVKLDNRTYSVDGRQQSLERMETDSLQIDRATGNITAAGPGWLSLVQPGSPNLGGLQSSTRPTTAPFASAESLSYLRVEFREAMQGNLNHRQVDFENQVQAVFGPVPHWDAEISMTSRAGLGDRGAILSTDRLTVAQFAETTDDKGAYELTTLGNTRVEGRDYEAFAHRLSFTTAKNQLVLEGDGRVDSKIKRSIDNSYLEAQRILFQPDINALQLDGSRVLSFGPASTAAPGKTVRPPASPRDVRSRQ